MNRDDADKTIHPEDNEADGAASFAHAMAQFDRVLAGEKIETSSSEELVAEFDPQAVDMVEFLGVVEQAWPRNSMDVDRDDQPGEPNRAAGDTQDECAAITVTEFHSLPEAHTSSRENFKGDRITDPVQERVGNSGNILDGDKEESNEAGNEDSPKDSTDEEERLCFGRFRILKQLGRGGYGNVYLAEDPNTRREIALKIPRTDIVLTKDVQRRFVREARLAAALDHPGIVRVYEAGEIGMNCYIASEYCPGTDMAKWMSQNENPVDQSRGAQLVIELADAVSHAHSRGVLHRDIKPSNILMTSAWSVDRRQSNKQVKSSRGEDPLTPLTLPSPPQSRGRGEELDSRAQLEGGIGGDLDLPAREHQGSGKSNRRASSTTADENRERLSSLKLCDFGLAKLDGNDGKDSILTRSGEMLGTPAYMAPEQVTSNRVVTEATDIYALGVILYELLTGEVPFRGDNHVEIMHRVIEEPPKDPRVLRRDLSRDLSAICLKCLEKEPTDRYASAAALSSDLKRFLDGDVVIAKLPSASQRLLAWAGRHSRLVVASAAVVLFFVSTLLTVQSLNSRRLESINTELDGKKSELEEANSNLSATNESLLSTQHELREHLYMADMWNASNALAQHDNRTVRQLLETHIPRNGEPDLRRTDWYFLNSASDPHASTLLGKHDGNCEKVCVTSDGKRAYSAGQDGSLFGYDLETGRKIASWKYDGQLDTVAVSDDGRYLLTGLTLFGSPVQTILVIDLESGEEKVRIRAHGYPINASAFSPDGKYFATSGRNSSDSTIIHTLNGELVGKLKSSAGQSSLVFTSDGQSLLSTARIEDQVALRKTSISNLEQFRDIVLSPAITGFSVSRHAGLMAVLEFMGDSVSVRELNEDECRVVAEVPSRGVTTSVEFSPSGNHVAVGTADGQVTIWDYRELVIHGANNCRPRVINQDSRIRSLVFVPGAWPTSLITSAEDGTVRLWKLKELNPIPLNLQECGAVEKQAEASKVMAPIQGFVDVVLDPSAKNQYYALTTDGRLVHLSIRDEATGSFTTVCQTKAGIRGKIAVSNTEPIAAVVEGYTVLIVALPSGEIIKRLGAPITSRHCHAILFQNRKLYGNFQNVFWSLDLDQMKYDIKSLAARVNATGVASLLPIPHSSSILMTACQKMFFVEGGKLTELEPSYNIDVEDFTARLSNNGKLLAIGDSNGQIALLDVEQNWKLIERVRVHAHHIADMQFTDDDRTLVSLCLKPNEIGFTDVASRKSLGKIRALPLVGRMNLLEGSQRLLLYSQHGSYIWNNELPVPERTAEPISP